jgi:hypothetical protein
MGLIEKVAAPVGVGDAAGRHLDQVVAGEPASTRFVSSTQCGEGVREHELKFAKDVRNDGNPGRGCDTFKRRDDGAEVP